MTPPKISIIIPNFNGVNLLKECVNSIQKQNFIFYEVIIVDNASKDNSIEYIKDNYPEFRLILNKKNLGFAAAVNQGIKVSKAEYIILLNNDVVLEMDYISNLLNCIKMDENIFSVSSKMIQYYDPSKIDDAGDEYTLFGWTEKVGNNKAPETYNKEYEIFSACAGAAIYRKKVFNEIGLFDEQFFAYMEDVDIGYRSRIYGYKNLYCPNAVVYHRGSSTTGSKYNRFKIKLAARNNIYVPYKNMPLPQLIFNSIFLIFGFLIKYFFFLKKGHGNDYISGLKDGLTSLEKVNKIKYDNTRFKNYITIEWLLIKNIVKIIFK
ncbi:MAG: glycosyltransferase family 2 protein [Methanobacterium sp.]|nr:glycosyltransferase family 2 protein [Methanobacterium sp.]